MPTLSVPWLERIAAHRSGRGDASSRLLARTCDEVTRVSRRYPAVYFELADRSPESVESLAHRVFTNLDVRAYGRFPFSDRVPFDTYLDEQFDDEQVRYHSFDSRLSITREALREQYAFNVRHHPDWADRERIHREVVAFLKESAQPWPGRSPRWPRYGLASWGGGPRSLRAGWDREDVVRILARRSGWPVGSRVELVLAKRGVPMYPGAISSLLQEAELTGPLAPPATADSSEGGARAARLLVRRTLATGWRSLEQTERLLLVKLLSGTPYREVVDSLPGYRDPSAVTRALARLCNQLLAPLTEGLGGLGGLRPQQQAELLFAALAELPEVRREREASHA